LKIILRLGLKCNNLGCFSVRFVCRVSFFVLLVKYDEVDVLVEVYNKGDWVV
jgi:hypothetical protein